MPLKPALAVEFAGPLEIRGHSREKPPANHRPAVEVVAALVEQIGDDRVDPEVPGHDIPGARVECLARRHSPREGARRPVVPADQPGPEPGIESPAVSIGYAEVRLVRGRVREHDSPRHQRRGVHVRAKPRVVRLQIERLADLEASTDLDPPFVSSPGIAYRKHDGRAAVLQAGQAGRGDRLAGGRQLLTHNCFYRWTDR